jgi:metallo-beta-lactamase family protein
MEGMNITFCGADREVTGSCYLVETASAKILVDCGIFQGGKYAEDKNNMPFPFNPGEIAAVVVTHAHFDHVGRLPKLVMEGFTGDIWCTDPTHELAMITLKDAVHLMADEAERHHHQPLYTDVEVEAVSHHWRTVPYHTPKEVAPGITALFSDAGHILGSASIMIQAEGKTVVFSGDLGNPPVPILRQTQCFREADVVIIESTYGNRVHEPSTSRQSLLQRAILDTVHNRGVLLIPAFALERTQELLYEIDNLHHSGAIPTIPIFLDSPLAIAATTVFRKYTDYMNTEAKSRIQSGDNFFNFPGLQLTETSDQSKSILNVPGPKVIIAGSGMMNGGRILHHLKNYLSSPSTTVLIIGFQVEGSLGRRLHQGADHVYIYGQDIDVRAKIISCGAFSGHADFPRLISWLGCFEQHPPRKVFVCHGELNSALSFSQAIEDHFGIASAVPEYGETIDVATLQSQIPVYDQQLAAV